MLSLGSVNQQVTSLIVEIATQNPAITKLGAGVVSLGIGFSLARSGKSNWQVVSGIALMALGAFTLASGINEFTHNDGINLPPDNQPLNAKDLQHWQLINRFKAFSQPGDSAVINTVISKLQSCPSAKKLWDNINAQGSMTVLLGDPQNVPSYAFWDSVTRTIVINRELQPNDQKLLWLLFESCNANHDGPVQAILKDGYAGDLSSSEFLKRSIEVEYQSAKLHHEIVTSCTKSHGWDSRIDNYKSFFTGKNAPWRTFEKMWESYMSDPNREHHRATYQRAWEKQIKDSFCAKNPAHTDCK